MRSAECGIAKVARRTLVVVISVCIILAIAGCGASRAPDAQIAFADDNDTDRVAEPPVSNAVITMQPQELPQPLGSSAEQPLNFLFFSDTQASPESPDYSDFGELLSQALSQNNTAGLVVFGGDIVNDDSEWQNFQQSAGATLDSFATMAVPGNHDRYDMLVSQFDYPLKTPDTHGAGIFYSFAAGPVFFIMLDSNVMGAAEPTDIEWLQGELQSEEARQADWRIAVMHHPMWPVADIPKDILRAETMRECFLPVMEEFGVSLIICGHQHVYARTLEMSGEAASSGVSGIIQIMAASGDKATYSAGERDYVVAGDSAPNYLSVLANSEILTVTAYNAEHRVIDSVTMRK